MIYFATFFSHFGAMHYKMLCDQQEIICRVMPVPRGLSSSCGTCVRCEGRWLNSDAEDLEQVAAWDGNQFTTVYHVDQDG